MTWLISRSTVPILSELQQVCTMMRQMDTTHPPDLSCDSMNITWRRNQELYMGDRAHFYLISIAAIGTLYRYSRQPLDTSVYIVQRKINGDTTKIDLQILMWNHYTPPLPPRKNSRNRVHCIYINGSQRTRHRSLSFNPGLHITLKYNNHQIKVKDFFYAKNLEDIFSDPSEIIYISQEKCHVISLHCNYFFISTTCICL